MAAATTLVAGLVVSLAPGLASTTGLAAAAATAARPRAATVSAASVRATGLYANATGLVMDAGGARKSGVIVRLRRDGRAHGKRWLRKHDGTIRPSYDTRLCLSVPRSRYRPGTWLRAETCHGRKSQRFTTRRTSRSTSFFFISPAGHRGLCVSLLAGIALPGGKVSLGKCRSLLTTPGEAWTTRNQDKRISELRTVSPAGTGITLGVTHDTAGSPAVATRSDGFPLGSQWKMGTEKVAGFG